MLEFLAVVNKIKPRGLFSFCRWLWYTYISFTFLLITSHDKINWIILLNVIKFGNRKHNILKQDLIKIYGNRI